MDELHCVLLTVSARDPQISCEEGLRTCRYTIGDLGILRQRACGREVMQFILLPNNFVFADTGS